jgi:pimeloyl-ACP methyl ester carboxylesterase
LGPRIVQALRCRILRHRVKTSTAILALLGLFAVACRAADAPLALSPCQIQHPARVTVINAECGTLHVPENPQDAKGRTIGLRIAKVRAISQRKIADPLFLIAGGPGSAASDLYAQAAPVFARILRDRDIVLLDQRGTGQSNALLCELDEEELLRNSGDAIEAETKRCLDSLSSHADVAYYTTSVAVQDLDRVRAALGYERINLYGSSYGTRVAQHYLRKFPSHTRSVILDGVVPPDTALGPAIALDAERALTSIFERCTRDAACRKHFGDPAVGYRALRAALQAKPVKGNLSDPTTGEPEEIEFGSLHLATVLRLATYSSEEAAVLPLAIDLAHRNGNFTPLAGQFLLMSRRVGDQLAYGMHNSVVCTEDVPFYRPGDINRSELAATFLGTTQLDALQNICKLWPRGPLDADLREPVRSDVPVLLLSGGNDPVTPPASAEQARRLLSNSMHVVLKDLGHGQLVAPCVDRVMADFVNRAAVKGLDVSCTRSAGPMPFFISPAGPAP